MSETSKVVMVCSFLIGRPADRATEPSATRARTRALMRIKDAPCRMGDDHRVKAKGLHAAWGLGQEADCSPRDIYS
jgi:hypothetical protein